MVGRLVRGLGAALVAAVFAFVLFLPTQVPARPELGARINSGCWKCHVNPTGGGMRNQKGLQSSNNLSLSASKDALAEKYPEFFEFDPSVGTHIQIGSDVRLMYFNEQDDPELTPEEQPEGSTFYLMQAALHAKAQLLPIFQVVYSYDAAQNAVEAFGLIDELPGGLYLKAGRFILPYGLRFDDHTIFTRAPLGFHNISQDSGVEIGVRPGPAFLVASLTNGNMGEQAMDRDKSHYAFTTQGGVRFWKIGVGGSYFLNNREGFDRQVFGPWATFGWGPVALLAEFDVFKQEVPHETRPGELDDRIGSGSMAQADVKVIDGLYVQGRYSHMDTDWEVDETFMDQWAGGLLVYPIPYLQLQAQYRWNREPDLVEYDNNQVMIQGHFFF